MADEEITQPSTPEGVKTANLPAVSPEMVAITLLGQTMSACFRETNANISLVSTDLSIVKQRVDVLEAERTKLSGGVRGLSLSDSGQNQEISNLAAKVDDLGKSQELQLAILGRLDKVASNPTVKLILFALGTIATGYLASKGLR